MTQQQKWAENGFGKSGEIYLVGQNGTLRNESGFLVEDGASYYQALHETAEPRIETIIKKGTGIGLHTITTEAAQKALARSTDFKIIQDYQGVDVLSAYAPVKVGNMNWAIMSEIDADEAFESVGALQSRITRAVTLIICVLAISLLEVQSKNCRLTGTFPRLSLGISPQITNIFAASLAFAANIVSYLR